MEKSNLDEIVKEPKKKEKILCGVIKKIKTKSRDFESTALDIISTMLCCVWFALPTLDQLSKILEKVECARFFYVFFWILIYVWAQ